MAYQFDSNNPFNIRGIMISPQKEDSNPPVAKHDVHYYFILIDVVQGTLAGQFVLANPTETGTNLTYKYVPTKRDAATLPVPTVDSLTQTFAFPVYTNQAIDKPNKDQNNLFAVLNANGTQYKGNPNSKNPPVFDKVYSAAPLTCFPLRVVSETHTGINFLVVLANTGSNPALNSGSITSNINAFGGSTYSLRLFFDPVTDTKPGRGHAVVCAGYVAIGANYEQVYTQLYAIDTHDQVGPTYWLNTPELWAGVPFETI